MENCFTHGRAFICMPKAAREQNDLLVQLAACSLELLIAFQLLSGQIGQYASAIDHMKSVQADALICR